MRKRDYDLIAETLRAKFAEQGPKEDYECASGYWACRELNDLFIELFRSNPNFDEERFRKTIESGEQ